MTFLCVGRNRLWRFVTRQMTLQGQARRYSPSTICSKPPRIRRFIYRRIPARNRKLWPDLRRSSRGTTNRRASKTPINAAVPASDVAGGWSSRKAAGAITDRAGSTGAIEEVSELVQSPAPAPSTVDERDGMSGLCVADAVSAVMSCTSREPRIEPNVPA